MAVQGITARPAFRFDVSPQTLKNVEAVGLPKDRKRIWTVLSTVIVCHILVLAVKPSLFWSTPIINTEEAWEVNMEFPGEISQKSPQVTALPNSQKSEEESVAQNLLPQLPKKFQIEEQKPVEEKTVAEEKDPDAEQALAEEKKVEEKQAPAVPKMEEDANKVELDDLRKRLAVEKLKQENKVSERMKAQKDAIAKLKQESSKEDAATNSGSAGGMVGIMRSNAYSSVLSSAVSRNFILPESFRYSQQKLKVPLVIIIGRQGELLSYRLAGTSGSDVYDNAAVNALKNAAPLPKPPPELVEKEIQFNF